MTSAASYRQLNNRAEIGIDIVRRLSEFKKFKAGNAMEFLLQMASHERNLSSKSGERLPFWVVFAIDDRLRL